MAHDGTTHMYWAYFLSLDFYPLLGAAPFTLTLVYVLFLHGLVAARSIEGKHGYRVEK